MPQRPRIRLLHRSALAVLAAAGLAACGGDSGGAITNPVKTCQEDPTQAKCQPVVTAKTLKEAAAATGRYFGASIYGGFRAQNSVKYDSVLAAEFSMLVAGNDMKWDALQPTRTTFNWTWADSMTNFAVSHGMKMRGHTLVWHNQYPAYIRGQNWSADTAKVVLTEHINGVVGHFKGKIYAWDVVNEPINDSGILRDTLFAHSMGGTAFFTTAFSVAKAADPNALLFWNDYNLENPGPKQDSTFAWISRLKAAGVPIEGIGFQGHLGVQSGGGGVPTQQTLYNSMARFAALGLKVEVTELDVGLPTSGFGNTELLAQQQAYFNIVAACKQVPTCDAVVVWGVNDGESWLGAGRVPLLFTDTYAHKDTYIAVMNALK